MNIALIGSGGRESALAWAISNSPQCGNLYILPGNGGTARFGRNVPVDIKPPFSDLKEFIEIAEIDLVVVGPEPPLVDGIVDFIRGLKVPVFGPTQKAARLEGSKVFMKEFLAKYAIPTAQFRIFKSASEAIEYVRQANKPFVVKTDGLAAGKGAIVNKTVEETLTAIQKILIKKEFGSAGDRIVVEDLLYGTEVSVFIVTDGKDYRWLASAQDHKRIFDNDEGPNTGGMGAFAPVPFLDDKTRKVIEENIIKPTIAGMQKEGCPYTGVLYLGLMLTKSGPSVIEYNVRFGDPEAQVVLPLLKTDFLDVVKAVTENKLSELNLDYYPGYCTCVVLASGGYPGDFEKGFEISGDLTFEPDAYVFHAGTKIDNGVPVTAGGRVLCVTAQGFTLAQSIEKAYKKAEKIHFKGMHYRKDIGQKGLDFIRSL